MNQSVSGPQVSLFPGEGRQKSMEKH